MTDLARHLHDADADMSWLTTIPHTIEHVVRLAVEREGRRRVQAAQSRGPSLGVSTSGHSDPTADAALAGIDETATEATRSIDAVLALVGESADELDAIMASYIDRPRHHPRIPGRNAILSSAVASCIVAGRHIDAYAQTLDAAERSDLEHLVRVRVAESAAWLRGKAEAIIDDAPSRDRDEPVQRAIVACRVCGPWRSGTIAGASGLCAQCAKFRHHHKCEPTEVIVRRWEVGKGATPGMILEAKASTKKRKARAS